MEMPQLISLLVARVPPRRVTINNVAEVRRCESQALDDVCKSSMFLLCAFSSHNIEKKIDFPW